MIKLDKQPEPELLIHNKAQWTADLMSYVNAGQKIPANVKNKYNHVDIKSVLRIETNGGKCMYCESPIAVVAPEHIEHYRPKATFPLLAFEWDNLGLSCQCCNINKGDEFDENCTYINPFIDCPETHFISFGTMLCHKPNDKRAQITELKLKLNRPELIEARKGRIDAIRPLIDQYVAETNPTLQKILKGEIKKEIAQDKPYSMCTKAFCQAMIPD